MVEPFDADKFKTAVGNVLGHLEVAAALVVDSYLDERMHRLVEETIIDYVNAMVSNGYEPYVSPHLIKPNVCRNLKDFCKQRGDLLDDSTETLHMLNI
jgi:hypothetical protein